MPDMIMISGDIAHGGKAEEYTLAENYFGEIATILERPPEDHWFLVPGNHDVDQDSIDLLDENMRNAFTDEVKSAELLSNRRTWQRFAQR